MTVSGELVFLAAALCMLPAVLMAAVEEGSASGWVEQAGARTALTHAFAVMHEDVLKRGDKEIMDLLPSDGPGFHEGSHGGRGRER